MKIEWKPEIKPGATITVFVRDTDGEPIREERGTLIDWTRDTPLPDVTVSVDGVQRTIEVNESTNFGIENGELYVAEYME